MSPIELNLELEDRDFTIKGYFYRGQHENYVQNHIPDEFEVISVISDDKEYDPDYVKEFYEEECLEEVYNLIKESHENY